MKNKLQKLLDEKFPSNGDIYNDSQMMAMRAIFTEGYNAAKEEYANPTENRTINIERLLNNYAAMIKAGPKVDAIMTYKRETGASITEAANILGIQNINNGKY